MRVAGKLVLVAILAIVLVSVVNGYYRVRREIALFHTDMRRDVLELARATTGVVAEAWRDGGRAQAETYVRRIDRSDHAVRVRLVWLGQVRRGETEARRCRWHP